MKAIAFVGALVALSLGFWACERRSSITEPAPDKSGALSIGVVLPLTGHLAATGQLMRQGFDLALDEINAAPLGRPTFKFIVEDDSSTVTGAVAAFERLIHQKGRVGYSRPGFLQCDAGGLSDCARQSGGGHQPDLGGQRAKRDR